MENKNKHTISMKHTKICFVLVRFTHARDFAKMQVGQGGYNIDVGDESADEVPRERNWKTSAVDIPAFVIPMKEHTLFEPVAPRFGVDGGNRRSAACMK